MYLTKIGEIISRIRTGVKSLKQDAFLTDRYIYSLIKKHAGWLMKRQDGQNGIMRFNAIFQTLQSVELIEVNAVEAQCLGVQSEITFMRTAEPLPALMMGYYGPLIRSVTTIDGQERFEPTFPSTYVQFTKQKTFKYNKGKYYWYLDGHLYFPKCELAFIRTEGVFDRDISSYNCGTAEDCQRRQESPFFVPDYLHGEIEAKVHDDLVQQMQLPVDATEDNLHPSRA